MPRRRRIVAAVIALLALACVASVYLHKPSSGLNPSTNTSETTIQVGTVSTKGEAPPGFLSVNGTQFVDENGNIVVLRGVNLSGYEYRPPAWIHNSSDFKTIADWGFNVIRLPISWEDIEPQPAHYNDSYLRLVDQDLAWAKQYSIYVVLDMHEICWSTQFASCNNDYTSGIPRWAVASYPDSIQGIDMMLHDFYLGLGPNGTTPSPTNPSIETRFFAAWKYVASRYSNDTTVAAYDVLNEPTQWDDSLDYNTTFTAQVLPAFYTDAIETIRSVDPNHICFFEDPTSISLKLPNVAYSPHYPQASFSIYDPANFTEDMNQLLSLSSEWNVPLFVGEWGMYANATGVTQYISDALSLFDYRSVSSAWWDYSRGNFSMDLFDSNGEPRQILVQNIVRPFLRQASAPAEVTTSFNATGQYYEQSIRFQDRNSTEQRWIVVSLPINFSAILKNTEPKPGQVEVQLIPQTRSLMISASPNIFEIVIEYPPSSGP